MKKVSMKRKLYTNIIPVLILGVLLITSSTYIVITKKYVADLEKEYQNDIEVLMDISHELILESGKIIAYLKFPPNVSGLEIYDTNNNLKYASHREKCTMMNLSCCEHMDYAIGESGSLRVYKLCEVDETLEAIEFKNTLIIAVILSSVCVICIGAYVIGRLANNLSSSLETTAVYADAIENGDIKYKGHEEIKEIDNIKDVLLKLGVRLAHKDRIRKERIDSIRHEINTPLTIIKSTLEGVEDGVIVFDQNQVKICMAETERIFRRVENLYEETENNHVEVVLELFDLKVLIEEIVNAFSVSFANKNIIIETNLESKMINSDKNLMTSIIYNLLNNAYKYSIKGSEVIINLDGDRLSIEDNGLGIGDKDKLKIFEPYFRGRNTNGIKGDGLGLSDARRNAEGLGYKLTLEEGDIFTKFQLTL